jgi:MFS family permease
VFTMARFSEAFLVLRAQDAGLALGYVPLVMVVMNLFYTASAYPAGAAADRLGARGLLAAGMGLLLAADILLALAPSPPMVLAGAALWGLHMGATHGLLAKLVADTAPAHLRGTAFGVFNLMTGVALLCASVLAGLLWNAFGGEATFLGGAIFAVLALLGIALYSRQNPRRDAH